MKLSSLIVATSSRGRKGADWRSQDLTPDTVADEIG